MSEEMTGPAKVALAHLTLHLSRLNRRISDAARAQTEETARLWRPDLREMCIPPEHVAALLTELGQRLRVDAPPESAMLATDEEVRAETALRVRAKAEGLRLPIDRLVEELALTDFELEAILACAAPEFDRRYERLFAYLADDLQRRAPSVEVIALLSASSLPKRIERQRALGPGGRLRRIGALVATGDGSTGPRQELRIDRSLLAALLGAPADLSGFRDPDLVPTAGEAAPDLDHASVARLGDGLARGVLSTVGVWGPRASLRDETAIAIARAAGRELRRLPEAALRSDGAQRPIEEALALCAELRAILLIHLPDGRDPGDDRGLEHLGGLLATRDVPLLLTGPRPHRPTALLAARPYAELSLPAPTYRERGAAWQHALPEIDAERAADLSARFRMSPLEMRAVAQVARTAAQLQSNGHPASPADHLDEACRLVIRRRANRVARTIEPTRRAADLVLAREQHRQVLEVAQFYRRWPVIVEEWGFDHRAGGVGMKALFTGEPGTGKTLAAEVVAGELGLPLLKIDLSQVVSKWIGETEKNLDEAFREAEEGDAVLFFDEADALFGKRGEVQRGTDRYANLEVSYLLQRLEEFDGLVILASNLKNQIDAAFTRRFHSVIHFPRPREEERRTLWSRALPAGAPIALSTDESDALARLDLTGAGISSAARTAALLAHSDGGRITMSHLVQGVAGQFRREARILTPTDLGRFAYLLQGA
jgi:hypothetical protein